MVLQSCIWIAGYMCEQSHDLLLYFRNHNLLSSGQSESFISASCSEKRLSGVQLIGLGSEARLEGTTSILEPGAAFDAMLHIHCNTLLY